MKTIGSSSDPKEIESLWNAGQDYITNYQGQQSFNFPDSDFNQSVVDSIKSIDIEGGLPSKFGTIFHATCL